MTDFGVWNAVSHSMVTLNDDVQLKHHGLEKTASYIIRKNGVYYEAIKGGTSTGTGTIAYGGADNAGTVDGTDATAVIQAALDNLSAGRTWKEKVAFKGNMEINDSVTVPNYTIIDLFGAKITQTANHSIFTVSANHNIEFLNGILDVDGLNVGIYGIDECHDILVDNVEIQNASIAQQGIYLRGYNLHVQCCKILGAGAAILLGRSESDIFTSYNVWAINNYIYNTVDDGIAFDLVQEGHIIGNIIDRNDNHTVAGSSGIKMFGACKNINILGNTVKNVGEGTFGINDDIDSDDELIDGAVIVGNTIIGSSTTDTRGILIAGNVSYFPVNVVVDSNVIKDVDHGIHFFYAHDCNLGKNNVFSGCNTDTYFEGTSGGSIVYEDYGWEAVTTSLVVTHSLPCPGGIQPNCILLTPVGAGTGDLYITDMDETTFKINISGAGTFSIYWHAIYKTP